MLLQHSPTFNDHGIFIGTALFCANQFLSGTHLLHHTDSSSHTASQSPPPGHSRIGFHKVLATSVASCNVRLSVSDLIVHQTSPRCPFSTTQSAGATIGRLMAMASQSSKPQGPRDTSLARILIPYSKARNKLSPWDCPLQSCIRQSRGPTIGANSSNGSKNHRPGGYNIRYGTLPMSPCVSLIEAFSCPSGSR